MKGISFENLCIYELSAIDITYGIVVKFDSSTLLVTYPLAMNQND